MRPFPPVPAGPRRVFRKRTLIGDFGVERRRHPDYALGLDAYDGHLTIGERVPAFLEGERLGLCPSRPNGTLETRSTLITKAGRTSRADNWGLAIRRSFCFLSC
jgi:hypothetical protein